MKLLEVYTMKIVRVGEGDVLEDYIVKLKAMDKRTIHVNAKELILMQANNKLVIKNESVIITMLSMDRLEIDDENKIEYEGFHELREKVRAFLKRKNCLRVQIEKINKILCEYEFQEYMNIAEGERKGFSLFFKERFPENVKKWYEYNIGYMFRAYQDEFEKEDVPKENIVSYETIYRTRYKEYGDSYVYPIKVPRYKKVATYRAKAAICTYYEILAS